MIIYICLIILALAFLYIDWKINNIKATKQMFWILCVVFTVISAIRYNVGIDYNYTYVNSYNYIKAGGTHNYEVLFLILIKFLIFINANPVVLMSLCSIVTIPMFFVFIKINVDKKYWILSALLFIISTIYFGTMNAVRQYLAIAILMFGFNSLKNKKYIKYALFSILASCFHTSALISLLFIPFDIILKKFNLKRSIIVIYIISLITIIVDLRSIINLCSFMIPERYAYMLNSVFFKSKNYGAVLKLIVPNILFILMLKDKEKIKSINKNSDLYFIAMYIYILCMNAFYGINMFIRIGWYFDYFFLLIIPMLLEFYKNNELTIKNITIRKFDRIFLISIIVYFICLTSYGIFWNNGHGVIPYRTIFNI